MEKCVCGREYNSPEWMAHHKDACAKVQEAEKLMSQRDHGSIINPTKHVETIAALADEVPGLVAEVRRLLLQKNEAVLVERQRCVDIVLSVWSAVPEDHAAWKRCQTAIHEKIRAADFVEKPNGECECKCHGVVDHNGEKIVCACCITLKPKSKCTCLFLLNGIHATECPSCTGIPGVLPLDGVDKRCNHPPMELCKYCDLI
jgi:hypothetical protein